MGELWQHERHDPCMHHEVPYHLHHMYYIHRPKGMYKDTPMDNSLFNPQFTVSFFININLM